MWNIFSCVYRPSVYLLRKNVCSDPVHIFWSGCLFFCCWVVWVFNIFWRLTPCGTYDLQIFPPSWWVVFSFCSWLHLLWRRSLVWWSPICLSKVILTSVILLLRGYACLSPRKGRAQWLIMWVQESKGPGKILSKLLNILICKIYIVIVYIIGSYDH